MFIMPHKTICRTGVNGAYIVYVKLREGVDAESMLKGFGKQFKEQLWKLQWGGALAAGEVTEGSGVGGACHVRQAI